MIHRGLGSWIRIRSGFKAFRFGTSYKYVLYSILQPSDTYKYINYIIRYSYIMVNKKDLYDFFGNTNFCYWHAMWIWMWMARYIL